MARGGSGDEWVVALRGAAHVVRPSQQQRLDRRELERVGGRDDRPHGCRQRARRERQPIDVGEEACGRHLQEVPVRAEPLVRLSLQQRGAQLARGRPHGVRVVDLAGQHQGVHLDGLVGAKGREAGQQLVQEHAEGPPIDGEAVAAARDHLGRGVLRRAAQRPGAVRRRGEVRGEPKVDELEVALGVEDEVLRLEVAVHDAALVVQVAEHVGDARGVEAGVVLVEAPEHVDQRKELAAEGRLEQQEHAPRVLEGRGELDDCGVAHGGEEVALAYDGPDAVRREELPLPQRLQGVRRPAPIRDERDAPKLASAQARHAQEHRAVHLSCHQRAQRAVHLARAAPGERGQVAARAPSRPSELGVACANLDQGGALAPCRARSDQRGPVGATAA
mmetsp:Transcript_21007/g.63140  ORF Transcript_21007/g.63140 Transcript_21007/m.63140 type:complete len:390 (-) Transcript_21007:239-1408(-)